MGRPANSQNKFYHYEIIMLNENCVSRHYSRTIKDVAEHLFVGTATIIRKLKDPEIVLRKYKDCCLEINRIKKPIYRVVEKPIEY